MKRLFVIIILCILPVAGQAADYYACNAAQNINGNSTWCTSEHRTGSCSGDGTYTAWSSITSSDTLHANGCEVVIPNTENATFTVAKITNKSNGTSTDGGSFTYATSNTYAVTVQADVEAGGTTSNPCLSISGSGTSSPAFTLGSSGSPVTITAGTASGAHGIGSSYSGTGYILVYGTPTGSSSSSTIYGISNGVGAMTIYGDPTGSLGSGVYTGTGTVTVYGSCVASSSTSSGDGFGCYGYGTGGIIVKHNMISGPRAMAARGKVAWDPDSAKRYIKFDGGGTAIYASAGLGLDSSGTQVSASATETHIKTTAYFVKKDDGAYTQGTVSAAGSAGGGAWGF